MENSPLFSVVIPTYNRRAILHEAIDSVLNQGVPVEVIVIDDGSTDDTAALISRYDERVRYFWQPNQGIAVARNAGMAKARGEFVSLLDSDDIWLPGKMEADLELFRRYPNASAIASDAESYREGVLVAPSWTTFKELPLPDDEPFFLPLDSPHWLRGSLFASCCLTIRKACLGKIGEPVFDPFLRSFGDWELEIKLLRYCNILVSPRITAKVRRFDDGTRGDRATPGHPPSPAQARTVLERRHRVVSNGLSWGGWPCEIQSKLEQLHADIVQQLA